MSSLRELLAAAVAHGASDVHLKPGYPPVFRIDSELVNAGETPLTVEDVDRFVEEILPSHQHVLYLQENEADFSLAIEGAGRFRVNVFRGTGSSAIALRHVKDRVPTFEELHLPPILQELALSPRGIILTTGTTGSGKSTTLAAIINHINQNLRSRILTVEDPVEYVFADALSIISQREVGLDTRSFPAALKRILRQDPDVIMIGEMRDAESFMAALAAAETGHLVLSTLHTGTASQTVMRILDFFPAAERDQLRMSLADNLRAVICQRLVPATAGGVRPATEIMINTGTVRKLIEKNMLDKLPAAIETGNEDGMQTFNQCIYAMIKAGVITEEIGLHYADNPEALRMNLKGVFLDEGRRILAT